MRKLLSVILSFFLLFGPAWIGAVVYSAMFPAVVWAVCGGSSPNLIAASLARQDVVDCHTAAVTGDTITLPAGTATDWTSGLIITKAITLKGAGAASTIIEDNIVGTAPLIDVFLVANQTTKILDIQIVTGSRTVTTVDGVVAIDANSNTADGRRFVLGNCKLDHPNGIGIYINRAWGLIHNCELLGTNTGNSPTMIYAFHQNSVWVDARFAGAAPFGTDNCIFIEDSTVTFTTGAASDVFIDGYAGACYNVRHNTITRGHIELHGTDSASRPRGSLALVLHDNIFNFTGATGTGDSLAVMRSGTAVIYNNTATNMTGTGANNFVATLRTQRTSDLFAPWGIADGFSPWDVNNVGNPIATGTVGSAGTLTMTDSGAPGWTTNQYEGYVIRKVTAPCNVTISSVDPATDQFTTAAAHALQTGDVAYISGHSGSTPHVQGNYTVTVVDATHFTLNGVNVSSAGSGGTVSLNTRTGQTHHTCSSLITANTSNQITFEAAFFGQAQAIVFSPGDSYQIARLDRVFDQPCTRGGTNLGGVSNPVWPNPNDQTVTPCYEWLNTNNGGDLDFSRSTALKLHLVENTHYVNDTEMPGFTDYVYPHPLQGGGTPGPPDVQKRSKVGNSKFGGVRVQ